MISLLFGAQKMAQVMKFNDIKQTVKDIGTLDKPKPANLTLSVALKDKLELNCNAMNSYVHR
jgi:hypothetical protein